MKSLVWSLAFTCAVKRLVRQNPQILPQIERALQQLAEDPFHPSLLTHKLKRDLAGRWTRSIDYSNRILFEFVESSELGEEILLLTLGSHDEVY